MAGQAAVIAIRGVARPAGRCARALAATVLAAVLAGCLNTSAPGRRGGDDVLLFRQAQEAMHAHDYPGAIERLELFLEHFPKSEYYTWGLQRLGEALQGLLEFEYTYRIGQGMPEARARALFLEAWGRYGCWDTSGERLAYAGSHFRQILEQYPDSPIADEAAYRLIHLCPDCRNRPDVLREEISQLEAVLEKYPSTSLRGEILYHMAWRCHLLYELYAFSLPGGQGNAERARQYRTRAIYLYRMVLKEPHQSTFSQKAWDRLRLLEDGRRLTW